MRLINAINNESLLSGNSTDFKVNKEMKVIIRNYLSIRRYLRKQNQIVMNNKKFSSVMTILKYTYFSRIKIKLYNLSCIIINRIIVETCRNRTRQKETPRA